MKKMLIDAAEKESVRVAITKDSSLIDYESEKIINERIKGNIYLKNCKGRAITSSSICRLWRQ